MVECPPLIAWDQQYIDKLQILGVRSFGNKVGETIQFGTPLTLIVGWNGSGKTTIIECLKYVTTGELPPNSKTGGAFIHDPKLCGEKEVLAQVMLAFRSTSGVRMVATRKLQLTVKKTTRSQKTLEGSLLMIRDGERHSISARVADMDAFIPQYLGVSKAILENVIFCHQDDSLWPMSEPSVLKKKFDEIFEALKYTKAIENIKLLRRKQNEELAKYRIIEQHAKEDKEKRDRAEKRSTELYDQIEAMRTEVGNINAKLTEAQEKAKEAYGHAARYEQIVAQLNGKRIALRVNRESVTELELNLKQMAESDDDLQSMLDQYEDRITLYGQQSEQLRQQYSDFKHELEENRAALGLKQSEIGKHEEQKAQHNRRLQQRESLIKEAAKRHGIRGFDYDITDKQVANFLETIGKMSRDRNRALDKARQDTQEEHRSALNVVNQLNESKSALNQRKETSRSQIQTNDRRISDIQKSMNEIHVDEGGEAILRDKKKETEQRLMSANSEADSERFDDHIREADTALRMLDEKKEALEAELVDATRFARDSAQIEYAQDELKGAEHSLETMKGVHGPRISQLVDTEWELATLENSFQRVLAEKGSKVKEGESHRDITQAKLDGINFKLANNESEQKKKRSELQKYEQTIRDAIGQGDILDFEETLQDLEERYEMASSDQAKFQAQIEYMQACLQVAEEHNQCRLCRRSLKDNKAEHFTRAGFISSIEKIIEKASNNAQNDDADELLAEVEHARKAKPSYELAMRVRDTELPALQLESAQLTSERELVNKQLEEQDSLVYDLQNAKHEVESLSKNVQSIISYHNQARELESKIKDLTAIQKAAGLSRGIDVIQEDLKKIGDEGRHAKASLTRLSADRDKFRNLVTTLELRIRDITAELNNAQTKLKEKRGLVDRIEELKTHNSEQRGAIQGIDKDIQSLLPQIEQAQAKCDDINRRGNERIQRLQDESSALADSVRQLTFVEQEISAYIDRGGPQRLAKTHRDIENLQGEIHRLDEKLIQATRQVKKIEDIMRDVENTKRAIGDNLRYRKAKRTLETLQVEIEELESHNAEQDKDRYEREAYQWQNDINKLSTEQARLYATLTTKDDQLKDLLEEWKANYADAAYKYREAHIKVETTKAAVEDLGRYGGALDKAIMKYHTLKMEEINRIIEELWKNAYQGTDVDKIRIRSDNETAKGNRSYNYRVVMVKQETEMDMRGRCSAGQKVLASIVIRLALAECFGTNCGLIALDEPTTNLDQQNIKGLAESLSEIIKIRRKQANFQLIVITHDEQFLRDMNCADYTEHYWRVGRNHEQQSEIRRQNISEVA